MVLVGEGFILKGKACPTYKTLAGGGEVKVNNQMKTNPILSMTNVNIIIPCPTDFTK